MARVYTLAVPTKTKHAIWIFDEAVFRLGQERAKAAGVSLSQFVTGLLQGAPGPSPRATLPKHVVRVGHRLEVAEPSCARCGHPVRKHTPKCYVMGCACRSVQA